MCVWLVEQCYLRTHLIFYWILFLFFPLFPGCPSPFSFIWRRTISFTFSILFECQTNNTKYECVPLYLLYMFIWWWRLWTCDWRRLSLTIMNIVHASKFIIISAVHLLQIKLHSFTYWQFLFELSWLLKFCLQIPIFWKSVSFWKYPLVSSLVTFISSDDKHHLPNWLPTSHMLSTRT